MPAIQSRIKTKSEAFKTNAQRMLALLAEVQRRITTLDVPT